MTTVTPAFIMERTINTAMVVEILITIIMFGMLVAGGLGVWFLAKAYSTTPTDAGTVSSAKRAGPRSGTADAAPASRGGSSTATAAAPPATTAAAAPASRRGSSTATTTAAAAAPPASGGGSSTATTTAAAPASGGGSSTASPVPMSTQAAVAPTSGHA